MIKTMQINNNYYTIADVYDDAAFIGKELEKIVANYGSDVIKDLMPKVISILELLENITTQNEKEIDEISELKNKIEKLEFEKSMRLKEKENFEKEVEEIDDKWRQETNKLLATIDRLKIENKKIQETLAQNIMSNPLNQPHQIVIKQEELDELKLVREENLKLKETIRSRDREINDHKQDLELLRAQVNRMSDSILNFRRKELLSQNQIQKLIQEKSELECKLKEQDHKINELIVIRNRSNSSPIHEKESVIVDKEIIHEKSNESIKQIEDSKDPNRPRYTLHELQELLNEKNELIIKLNQTQEELEAMKKKDDIIPYVPGEVQGPINREPDEKLDNNSKQSGIRRFFSSLFS